jgi:hypothetical protein
MTPGDQVRKEEDVESTTSKKPDDKAAPPAAKDAPKKPAGLNYNFKFAPADPKNSFDFEDTADK